VALVTDHKAVNSILDATNRSMLNGGQDCLAKVSRKYLQYCPQSWQGKADALSRNSCGKSPVEGIGQVEVHDVATITSNLGNLLSALDLI